MTRFNNQYSGALSDILGGPQYLPPLPEANSSSAASAPAAQGAFVGPVARRRDQLFADAQRRARERMGLPPMPSMTPLPGNPQGFDENRRALQELDQGVRQRGLGNLDPNLRATVVPDIFGQGVTVVPPKPLSREDRDKIEAVRKREEARTARMRKQLANSRNRTQAYKDEANELLGRGNQELYDYNDPSASQSSPRTPSVAETEKMLQDLRGPRSTPTRFEQDRATMMPGGMPDLDPPERSRFAEDRLSSGTTDADTDFYTRTVDPKTGKVKVVGKGTLYGQGADPRQFNDPVEGSPSVVRVDGGDGRSPDAPPAQRPAFKPRRVPGQYAVGFEFGNRPAYARQGNVQTMEEARQVAADPNADVAERAAAQARVDRFDGYRQRRNDRRESALSTRMGARAMVASGAAPNMTVGAQMIRDRDYQRELAQQQEQTRQDELQAAARRALIAEMPEGLEQTDALREEFNRMGGSLQDSTSDFERAFQEQINNGTIAPVPSAEPKALEDMSESERRMEANHIRSILISGMSDEHKRAAIMRRGISTQADMNLLQNGLAEYDLVGPGEYELTPMWRELYPDQRPNNVRSPKPDGVEAPVPGTRTM